MTLKSLAHKDWPYAGSAHEWRGFVKGNINQVIRELPPDRQTKVYARADELIAAEFAGGGWVTVESEEAIYQKQNFGPELK